MLSTVRSRLPLLLAAMLAGSILPADGAVAEGRPSVLVLALDTVRADHLGCAGNEEVLTPAIDELARDGIRFARAHSTAPWTLPSFSSVLTGLLPYRHGAIGGEHQLLGPENLLLSELLRDEGYATASCVTIKWLTKQFGLDQGFDRVRHVKADGNDFRGGEVTDWGGRWADGRGDRPFFMFLHYFDAHAPYLPPAPFDRMYYDGDERAPGAPLHDLLLSGRNLARQKDKGMYDWLEGVTDLEYPVRQYAAGVSHVDHHVGEVLRHLRETGRYDDMLIVLLADHGEHLTEHDLYFTHAYPYQEAIAVPLIVKLPGGEHAGRVVREPVSLVDVFPTVCGALGIAPPEGLDGRNLMPLITDDAGRDPGPRAIVAEHGGIRTRFFKALVEWPWKLHLFRTGGRETWALYDLEDDPGELRDISREHPDVLQRLRARMWTIFDHDRPLTADPEARPVELDEETRQRLRSLGY